MNRPEPQGAVGRFEHRREAVAANAFGRRAIEQRKAKAVESDDPGQRGRPQIAGAAHVDETDDVLGEARLGGPDVDAVLRGSSVGMQENDRERDRDTPERMNPVEDGKRHAITASV
ncbi:MAG: hypothetical protein ABIX28_24105 [Vicinamibacterales bacterium]